MYMYIVINTVSWSNTRDAQGGRRIIIIIIIIIILTIVIHVFCSVWRMGGGGV